MSNVFLAHRNRADAAALSGGDWTAGLPLDNLKGRDISLMARSTNALAASTQFVADLGALRTVRVVALIGSNCSVDATYRVRVYADAGLTDLKHDSGTLDVWPAWMYAAGVLEWEDPRFWDGRPLAEDIEHLSSDVIYPLPIAAVGRYVKVEIIDAGNSDGYLEFGRLFVGDGWQPTYNMGRTGTTLPQEDLSSTTATPAGKEFHAERGVRRSMRFELKWLSHGEGALVQDMQRTVKTVGEVLVVFDPSDLVNVKRTAFLGRLRQLGAREWPFPTVNAIPFEIQEIL